MSREEEREKEITEKAEKFANALSDGLYFNGQQHKCRKHGFIQGAQWSDQHPRKGLVDIEKACKWIEKNIYDYYTTGDGGDEFEGYFDQMIDDFRKAMEE